VSISASELLGKFKDKPGGIASFTEPGCTHWIVSDPWPTHGMYNVYPGEAATGASAIKLIVSYISRTHQPDMYNKAVTKYNSVLNLDPLTNPATFTDTDGDNDTSWSAWRGWIPAQNGMVRGRITDVNNVASGAVAEMQFMLQQAIKFGYLYSDPSSMNKTLGAIIQKTYQAGNTNTETPKYLMPPMFTCGQISAWSSEQKKYIFTQAPFSSRDCRVFLSKEDYTAADKDRNGPKTAQTNQVFPPPGYDGSVINRAFVTGSEGNVNILESLYAPKDGDGKVFIRKKDIAAWSQWINYICQALQQYISDGKYTGGFCGGWLGNNQIVAGVQSRLKLGSMDDATRTLINLGWKTGADSIFGNPLSFLKNSSQMRAAFQEIISIIRNFLNNDNVFIIDETNYECPQCYNPGIAWLGISKSVSFGFFLMDNGWFMGTCDEEGPVGLGFDGPPSANQDCLVTGCPNERESGINRVGKQTYINYSYCYIPKTYRRRVTTITNNVSESVNGGSGSSIYEYWACVGFPTDLNVDTGSNISANVNRQEGTVVTETPFPWYNCCECDGFWEDRAEDPADVAYWTAWLNLIYSCFSNAGLPERTVEVTDNGNYSKNAGERRKVVYNISGDTDEFKATTTENATKDNNSTTTNYFDYLNHPTTVVPPSSPDKPGQGFFIRTNNPGGTTSSQYNVYVPAGVYSGDHDIVCKSSGTKNMIVSQIGHKGDIDVSDSDSNNYDNEIGCTGEFSGNNYRGREKGNSKSSSNSGGKKDNTYLTLAILSQEMSPAEYAGAVSTYLKNATQYVDATAYFYNAFPENYLTISQQINSILKGNSQTKNDDINAVLSTYGVGGSTPGKAYYNINDWNQGYTAYMSRHMVAFTANGSYALTDQEYELKFIIILYTMTGSPGQVSLGTKFQPPGKQYTNTYDSYTTNVTPAAISEVKRRIPKGTGTFDGYISNDPQADKFLWICSAGGLQGLSQGEKDWVTAQGYGAYLAQGYYLTPVAKKNEQED